jgi:tetratricopeptide (TPR) repeat protein
VLCPLGDFERARRELNLASELEPVSLTIATSLGILSFFRREYDAAIAQFRAVLEMDENFFLARLFLAQAYAEKKMYRDSLREMQRVSTSTRESAEVVVAGCTHALAGHIAEARTALSTLQRRATERYVSPVLIAQLQVALHDYDAAIVSLEEAFRLRSTDLIWLNVRPSFDPIRQDGRFTGLLQRMGLLVP